MLSMRTVMTYEELEGQGYVMHVRTHPPSTTAATFSGVRGRVWQRSPHTSFKAVSPTSQAMTSHGQDMQPPSLHIRFQNPESGLTSSIWTAQK